MDSLKRFLWLLVIGHLFLLWDAVRKGEPLIADPGKAAPAAYVMRPPKEKVVPRPAPKAPASVSSPVSKPVYVLGVDENHDQGFRELTFDFSGPVKLTRINNEGKLLRIRIQPNVKEMASQTMALIQEHVQKFSAFNARNYSEWVFHGKGKIGEPFYATSSTGLSRIIVPFRESEPSFPLGGGDQLENGAWYYKDRPSTKSGHADAFILRVDPMCTNLSVFPVLANEGICQKEVLSSMGRRYQSIAAINGAYFTHRGDPIGTLIINRKLISSPLYNRSVFGINGRGLPLFGNPDFSGTLLWNRQKVEINAVNQPRPSDGLVIYTPEFARSTMNSELGTELVLVKNRVVGIHKTDALIPPDGVVVSAGGKKAAMLAKVRLGDMVDLNYQVNSSWDSILHAVCGGPRLLKNGEIDINGREEKFDPGIVSGRHPRSGAAVTKDGELLFIVIDGRSRRSSGMTLTEFASYVKKLGGVNAINLDGGGSSSMLIQGKIVNRPSDGKERPISNGILISKK